MRRSSSLFTLALDRSDILFVRFRTSGISTSQYVAREAMEGISGYMDHTDSFDILPPNSNVS